MENETIFIILGLALTGLALVISFIGVRAENFPPSQGVLLGGVGASFVALIGATAVFALVGGRGRAGAPRRGARLRRGANARRRDGRDAGRDRGDPAEAEGEAPVEGEPAEEGQAEAASADGAALFDEQGCAGCHTLAARRLDAGLSARPRRRARGRGRRLHRGVDRRSRGRDRGGLPGGRHAATSATRSTPEEIEALVAYISETRQRPSSRRSRRRTY